MDNALAAMIQSAAGTGAPTNPSSRYYGDAVEQMTTPAGTDNAGTVVAYLSRRIIPQPGVYPQTQKYTVVAGDRIDNLAARYLGDPILFWMILDANGAMDPDELTATPGRVILIPLVSGIPTGARNG
jgi:nucleoid-associated protein YgaU